MKKAGWSEGAASPGTPAGRTREKGAAGGVLFKGVTPDKNTEKGEWLSMRKLKHENKKRVNLRLEPSLITALRRVADREGMAYQTMIRQWLWEKVKKAEGA